MCSHILVSHFWKSVAIRFALCTSHGLTIAPKEDMHSKRSNVPIYHPGAMAPQCPAQVQEALGSVHGRIIPLLSHLENVAAYNVTRADALTPIAVRATEHDARHATHLKTAT